MSESEPPQRNRSATIQIDAVEDLELLPDSIGPAVEGGASLPPPLPPKGSPSLQPSQAPPPRSPLVFVAIAVVGLAAAGLGIYLATNLLSDPEPVPEAETTLEIGDIHISSD